MKIKSIAIITTLLLNALIGYLSIYILEEYGWAVFFFCPFIIGFTPPFLVGRKQSITLPQSLGLSFLTLGLAILGLLVFAIEGLICIVMSLPIVLVVVLLASILGYMLNRKKWLNNRNSILLFIFIGFASLSFDYVSKPMDLIPVRTKIKVNVPIEKAWNYVVTFDTIKSPNDWIFSTGISYPTHATIKGTGVGAIRYCNFSTGSFVEPITTWNEPNLLQFDVIDQPTPMNEFNPFWDIHPPHLDGYFKSYKGQFQLTKIDDNSTEIEGTTWYKVDISPQNYWGMWSEFIIHKIHLRVLNHIKEEAEKRII